MAHGTYGGAGSVYLRQYRPTTHARFTIPGKLLLFPTNNYSISVPASFNTGLSVHFNKPIATDSFSPDEFVIQGPLGVIVPTGISEIGDRLYRIAFPSQTENGAYHFSLSPTLLDIEGFQLDQNANGIPGEPEDAYTFTLILDTVPPRITQHTPAGDLAGTVSSMDVWFSEAMDPSTLNPGAATLTNPSGEAIGVTSVQEVGLNRWRFGFPPQTATGLYTLSVSANVTDPAGNQLSTLNAQPLTFNLVPVDLQLADVAVSTTELWAGDPITVSWTGRNATGAPLLGDWLDAVYLSRDAAWDISDIRLATVPHTGGLAENETYTASATVYVPGVLPGDFHLLIRADIANQEKEAADESNNLVAFGPLPLAIRALTPNGAALSGVLTPDNRAHYYVITLAPGESMKLSLAGQTTGTSSELFVNWASIPSRTESEYRTAAGGVSPELAITGPAGGGTAYVLVYGDQVAAGSAYNVHAEVGDFFVTSITPDKGAKQALYGPVAFFTPPTVVSVEGVGFQRNMTVEFLDSGGRIWSPQSIQFVSAEALVCQLDVQPWPQDSFAVRVRTPTRSFTKSNGFAVTQNGSPVWSAHLLVPSAISPGYPVKQTLWIEYSVPGKAAMTSPILILTAEGDALLTADEAVADAVRATRVRPPGLNNTVQVMAVGSSQTPGILQPGEEGRIAVYYLGLTRDSGAAQLRFSLRAARAEPTVHYHPKITIAWPGSPHSAAALAGAQATAGADCYYPTMEYEICRSRIDWDNDFSTLLRPESISEAAWAPVFSSLALNIGTYWQDYVATLAKDLNHLATVGQRTTDPALLFNFEVAKASAALHPVRTLASAVDAVAPAPGLPITFKRTFANGILPRWRFGALGRGWVHNWEVSVQVLSNSDAVLRGPGGVDRFFRYTGDGNYTPSPGDYGRLTFASSTYRLTEPDQTVWQFNADHQLDFVQDSNGNRITLAYEDGRLTTLTHSNGKQLLLDYAGNGRLAHLTDPLGPGTDDDLVTIYEYDPAGEHLATVTKPGQRITRYEYITEVTEEFLQRRHALKSTEYPDLTHDLFEYDTQGRLTATAADGGAQRVEYRHDALGNITVVDATDRKTVLRYGLGGQLAQVEDGEGRRVNFGYNATGQLANLVGPGRELYRYAYDRSGNLAAITDPLRRTNLFSFEAAFNRLQTVTDARRNSLGYSYDDHGNLTGITYADRSAERFGYFANGLVLTSTNRRGGVITYAYNSAGQLINKWWLTPGGRVDYTYQYNAAGALETAAGPEGTTTLTYEPETLRLKSLTYPGGQGFTFEYDAAGKRVRRLDHDGHVVGYAYDTLGRLDRMTDGLNRLLVDYDYDAAGRLARKTLGNGVYTVYANNAAGQIVSLHNYRADATLISSYEYAYDEGGRRTVMRVTGPHPRVETYGYDPLGQLTNVTDWTADGLSITDATVYRYDEAGNRYEVIRTEHGALVEDYVANELNQYTSAGDATFTYDADGNMTSKVEDGVESTYAYDIENRLVSVTTPTDTWTYEYDAFGNRIATIHNGQATRYVVDPMGLGNVAAEYDTAGALIARYEHGFGLLARTDATGDPAFYTFSAIGHTSEMTDTAGAVLNSYSYDPWRVHGGATEVVPNPFRYVGEFGVMHEGNGLEFMRSRYYWSRTGRFVSRDPIGIVGDGNLYSCVRNAPTTARDPLGLFVAPVWFWPIAGWVLTHAQDILDTGLMIKDIAEQAVQGFPYAPDFKSWQQPHWVIPEPEPGLGERPPVPPTPFWPRPSATRTEQEIKPHDYEVHKNNDTLHIPPPIPPGEDEDEEIPPIPRSRDPNDKTAPAGYDSSAFLPLDDSLAYRVRFENVADATAPAQQVVVTDVLDEDFDLDTFELSEITFANQTIPVPYGLSHYQTQIALIGAGGSAACELLAGYPEAHVDWLNGCILVDVIASLDRPTRTLTLRLDALDPDTGWWPDNPLVGLLPPNDGTGRGEGSISYLVRPKTGLPSGTRLENRARIVFDYNDPIDTPLVFNTIDSGVPSSRVESVALFTAGANTFTVHWSAADDTGGSGVANVDLYGSTDAGDYVRWMESLAEPVAFQGVHGSTYRLFTVARDHVGNEEAWPDSPDATVLLNQAPVAGDDALECDPDSTVRVRIAKLLANDADPDADAFTFTGVDTVSTHGAAVTADADYVSYTAPPGFTATDSFRYAITDTLGGSAAGTVTVVIRSNQSQSPNIVDIERLDATTVRITFVGIRGREYGIQATADLAAPNWERVATRTAGENGIYTFEDALDEGATRFYRAVWP